MPRATKKMKSVKKRIGRPPLAEESIRLEVRLDLETYKALTALAKDWDCTRSEALRRTIKERAKRTGLV